MWVNCLIVEPEEKEKKEKVEAQWKLLLNVPLSNKIYTAHKTLPKNSLPVSSHLKSNKILNGTKKNI